MYIFPDASVPMPAGPLLVPLSVEGDPKAKLDTALLKPELLLLIVRFGDIVVPAV